MERCGVAAGAPARDLARRIAEAPNLRFEGLQAYHGRAQHLADRRRAPAGDRRRHRSGAEQRSRRCAAAGLPCASVSGAGTGTFRLEAASGVYNELQVGSYVFMDTDYARIGGEDGGPYREFEHSLFVLCRGDERSGARPRHPRRGAQIVQRREGPALGARRSRGSRSSASPTSTRSSALSADATPLRLGDKLRLIPGHCDPTVNLHDWYVGVRAGYVEALWPITARGASR